MNTTRTPHSSSVEQGARPHRVSRLFAAATAAFAVAFVTTLGTGTAQAATWGGGQMVSSSVFCNRSSHTMDVTAATSQMYNYPAYTEGQYISYEIFSRDVTYGTGGWVLTASWSPWQKVTGTSSVGASFGLDGTTKQQAVTIGTTRLYGTAGHNYQIAVAYDWWMGTDAIGTDYAVNYIDTYRNYSPSPQRML